MNLNEIQPYLRGSEFSAGVRFQMEERHQKVLYRMDYLEQLVANKKIVHVGFADHQPLLEKKIEDNEWLHNRLISSAAKCIGVDINEEAVEYIKTNFKIPEIYKLDLVNDDVPDFIAFQKWDYAILGEILEHVGNPVEFLNQIKQKYKGIIDNIVITVPNAFSISNFTNCFRRYEFVNSDHKFWFTPYTLAKVVSDAGFTVHLIESVQIISPRLLLKKILLKKYPLFRSNLVAIAKL